MINRFALLSLPLLAASVLPAVAAPSLLGSWKVASIDGAKPISTKAGVTIEAKRIHATAGCNGLGGEYTRGKGRLNTGPFMSTMMYCEGLMDQEQAMARLLEAKPAYRFERGRLVLRGGGHRLVLVRG